jgi:hypothetical protein
MDQSGCLRLFGLTLAVVVIVAIGLLAALA